MLHLLMLLRQLQQLLGLNTLLLLGPVQSLLLLLLLLLLPLLLLLLPLLLASCYIALALLVMVVR